MRSPAILTAVLAAASVPVFGQTLSWEDLDRRNEILHKAVDEAREVQRPAPDNDAERAAYLKLGEALSAHPEMASYNQALKDAKQVFQTVTATGDPGQISAAQANLAFVMTARFNQANSIPELKTLIEQWQAAATGVSGRTKPSPGAGKNPRQITTMLGQRPTLGK